MANQEGGILGRLRRLLGRVPREEAARAAAPEPAPAIPAEPAWEPAGVEDLVSRYLAARGGRERLAAIRTVRMAGKVTGGELKGVRVTVEKKRPGKYRQRLDDKEGPTIHAVDGEIAWEMGEAIGVSTAMATPRPAARRFKRASDIDGIWVDAAAKGHRLELAGRERVGATEAFKVKVHFKEGDPGGALFFDAARGLLVRSVEMMISPGGGIVPAETTFSDFREIGGVLWPFSETIFMPRFGLRQTYIWDTLEVDVPMDDAVFVMPRD